MIRKVLIPLLLLVATLRSGAQELIPDSAYTSHKPTLVKRFVIPCTLIGLGVYGAIDNHVINVKEIREERTEYFPNFSHKADNYLQFAPIPAVFLMDAFGLKATHSWNDQLIYFAQSELIMMAVVYPLKQVTHVPRPDNSSDNSFPSGHTAQAFLAAHFFQKEFGSRYPWASAGMYAVATGIGVSRVLNNRHWASDVLAGAGIGMASVELSYLLGTHRKSHTSFAPVIIPSYAHGVYSCSMVMAL